MSRPGVIVLAALLAAAVAPGPLLAQTSAAPGAQPTRAVIAKEIHGKVPDCKAQASRQELSYTARAAFMRQCLKG